MPTGPAGGPRPLAKSSLVIEATSKDQFESASEVSLESGIRRGTDLPQADVTVSETNRGPGETITVITNEDFVLYEDVEEIATVILNTFPSLSRDDVTVRVSSPKGPVGGPRIFASTSIMVIGFTDEPATPSELREAAKRIETVTRSNSGVLTDASAGDGVVRVTTNRKSESIRSIESIRNAIRAGFDSRGFGASVVNIAPE